LQIAHKPLPLSHIALALAVVAVWGTNFVVIRWALDELPPLLFATLRFFFAVVPAVFFLKRPNVPLSHLAAYGVLIGVGQFGLLYIAMGHDISPGIASLVVQAQVFFTILLAMAFDRERIKAVQIAALALAVSGICVIGWFGGGDATILGLILVLGAALSWACGNHVAKQGGKVNMLAYVVWSSLFSVPPLLALSLMVEGVDRITSGLANADFVAWAAVIWQSAGNTMFGYASWAWLFARHPTSQIAPMALAVPVFGMGASALVLGEGLPVWKLAAAALILAGLAINLAAPAIAARKAK
jgi:O-acetylserine/cysteine efflux transporter